MEYWCEMGWKFFFLITLHYLKYTDNSIMHKDFFLWISWNFQKTCLRTHVNSYLSYCKIINLRDCLLIAHNSDNLLSCPLCKDIIRCTQQHNKTKQICNTVLEKCIQTLEVIKLLKIFTLSITCLIIHRATKKYIHIMLTSCKKIFFEQKHKISSNLQPNLGNKPGLLEKESDVLTTMLQELCKFRTTQPTFTLTLFWCLYC